MDKLSRKTINAIMAILDRDNTAEIKKDKSGNVVILEVKKKIVEKSE